jgi:hypothetical protein
MVDNKNHGPVFFFPGFTVSKIDISHPGQGKWQSWNVWDAKGKETDVTFKGRFHL